MVQGDSEFCATTLSSAATMSIWFALSRAVFAIIGAGALLMSIGGLTGGASLTDPVFPAGLVLGVTALGAAIWADGAARWKIVVAWLGIAAVLLGVGIFGWFVFTDFDIGADVYPYFLVPAAIIVLSAIGMIRGRVAASAAGS